ncbi:MAG: monofunctional biosynthetic peptidoglycan transglycosylase [Alphaproteobacteria bacterium]|nr:monofunctional biosynthetic peptidoglycan transglycosylase [Alphaproteobacteria bacterium]
MIRPLRFVRRLALGLILLLLLGPILMIAIYRVLPVPITPLMVIRLVEGEGLRKSWVPLDRISAYVPEGVIAAEDNLFCSHGGFDWDALENEVGRAFSGERPRGASTITMQVAKNLFLWPGRDIVRKVAEAYLTLVIEALWDKRRIMEVYLNIAEWGQGVFGVEAAAQINFRTSANSVSRREAALLAAALPNPRVYNVNPPSPYVAERAIKLKRRMSQLGPHFDCLR